MVVRPFLPGAVLGFIILIAAAMYCFGDRAQYILFTSIFGATPFYFPFLDAHGVLSAIECNRLGFDVYALNPCDALGRVHTYSPLWLHLSVLPIDTSWTPAVGLTLVALFLSSLSLLPPARGVWQLMVIVAGATSPAVVYAIERGNFDLLVFFCVVVAVRLVQWSSWLRFLGYASLLFVGALKFYPAAALLLITRERIATAIVIGLIATACLAGFLVLEWHDFVRAVGWLPRTCHNTNVFELNDFGSHDLPCGIALLADWPEGAATLTHLLLGAATIVLAIVLARRSAGTARLTELEATSLLAASAVIIFCFFTAQNVFYRAIFLLLVLPGLTAMAGSSQNSRFRRYIPVLLVLLLLGWHTAERLFDYFFHTTGSCQLGSTWSACRAWTVNPLDGAKLLANVAIWLSHELLWWVVITLLAGLSLSLLVRTVGCQDLQQLAALIWMNLRNFSKRLRARHQPF